MECSLADNPCLTVEWRLQKFAELSPFELYSILRLRSEVFVVEQKSIYLDLDNKDQLVYHLGGWQGKNLVAYSRLISPGISYSEPSIGRVVTAVNQRRFGVGRALLQESIRLIELLFNGKQIRISAQLYLKKFYESYGFIQDSEVYDEDGIQHIQMIRRL
ncbi:MAG: GNAT family N-acetyltransferase [Proteobacteria bacterium]|nr:GNAT family N-acetyltransferase [Pseudomonadota bacterium]